MSRKPDKGLTYRDAGVDIDAQDEALSRIKGLLRSTRTEGVLSELGSFGGLFRPDLERLRKPVLVSSCDGVGTKLRVAFETGVHDTIGRDLVNHCVNDILVQGANPLFFMDYIATGKLEPQVLASIVEGIASGCRDAGAALLGGETAEMPGFYADGEYDVAGFIVGLVDQDRLLGPPNVREDQVLVGLPSAGLHTNGFSLARKILFEVEGWRVTDSVAELGGTVGEILLTEHLSYKDPLTKPLSDNWVAALSHITGGGLTDNLPRVLPAGLSVEVHLESWPVPPLFTLLQRAGNVSHEEMYRTFNMGIGMVAICNDGEAVLLECHLDRLQQPHYRIGRVVRGDGQVLYG